MNKPNPNRERFRPIEKSERTHFCQCRIENGKPTECRVKARFEDSAFAFDRLVCNRHAQKRNSRNERRTI